MHHTQPSGSWHDAHSGAGSRAGRLTIDVLGPMTVSRGGAPMTVGPAMVRHLLAVLALHAGRTVPRQEIVDVLWDGNPPATHINLTHVYASRLRAQLRDGAHDMPGAAVVSWDHGGYQLRLEADAVDLTRFDRLVLDARRIAGSGDVAAAGDIYREALRCWRGPVLAGAEPRFGQLPVVVAANQRRITVAVEFGKLCCALGEHQPAVDVLRDVSDTAPLHEGLHACLMLALAGLGDRPSALAVYAEIRHRLVEELGVDPGAELQSAHLHVLRDGGQDARAVPAGPDAAPTGDAPVGAAPDTLSAPAPGPAPMSAPTLAGPAEAVRAPDGRRRWAREAVAAALTLAVLVVAGIAWVDDRPVRPSPARPPTASSAAAFSTAVHWHWAYAESIGGTTTGEQWASAQVSGLTDEDSCAGFRFRVGASPEGDGDEQGILVAVCRGKWELEARPVDFMHVDATLAATGALLVAISATNLVTVTFNGAVVAKRQLRGSDYAGRHITAAVYQADAHVTLTDIRSNAMPAGPAPAAPSTPR